MGALPKHKVSRHQRGNRRRHQVLTAPHLVTCPNCSSKMMPHRVCKECGYFRGRQIIEVRARNDEEE
ncbi:MAG: 50S ribosomal protein L32 [Chloroflexaceae bacterium]|nr:50S ribosomal protein L32 [Chloroflexaceae bacterium]NJL32617.1 50S ribosomal protein L32 [Chloroflexaceae bacterium]NJO04732.1 50S ribosomal protein L32 [Chloroflexaceae bacterium]